MRLGLYGMSDKSKNNDFPVIDVNGLGEQLAKNLLIGNLVAYHDSDYQVTSGPHEILMKLLQHNDEMIIFYVHIPYAYPMPDGVRSGVKSDLETALNKRISKIEFVNAGTESQKRNMKFRLDLGE